MKKTITALAIFVASIFSYHVMADIYGEQQKMDGECQAKINSEQQGGETFVESRVRISQATVDCAKKIRSKLQAMKPKTFDVIDISDAISLKVYYPVEVANNVILSQTVVVSPTKHIGMYRWVNNSSANTSYMIFSEKFCDDHGEDIAVNGTLVRFAVTYGTVAGVGNVCYGYPLSRDGEDYVRHIVHSNESINVDGITFSMKGLSEFSHRPAL